MTAAARSRGLDRRQFLTRAGVLGAATALWQIPALLRVNGWYDPAYALEPNLVRDTMQGLAAFVWPGRDMYSVHQEEYRTGDGAVAAGTADLFIEALDSYLPAPHPDGLFEGRVVPLPDQVPNPLEGQSVPVPDAGVVDSVPLSGAVANLLNVVALTVQPQAMTRHLMVDHLVLAPFSRLLFREKAEVFGFLEEQTAALPDDALPQPFTRVSGNFEFVAGIIPGFVAFLAFSEAQVFDPETRTLSGRPVGWDHTGYQGDRVVPVEGWDELLGFYRGVSEASTEWPASS